MKALILACAFACPSHLMSATVSAPSGEWTALLGNFDFLEDQQTGLAEGDIVGVGQDHGFFVTHNSSSASVTGQATFGFRLRFDAAGGNSNEIHFNRAAWLGIDADTNGSIDVFVGVDMTGSSNILGIYSPGTGTNNSPGSTSISSTPYRTYAIGATNYNYRPVNHLIDGGTTNDLTPGKKVDPDYYLSVLVPFADIVGLLAGKNISVNASTPLRYVAATSTQGNKINQDISGVNAGIGSDQAWTQLGALSPTMTYEGAIIPEPNTAWMGLLGVMLLLRRRRA